MIHWGRPGPTLGHSSIVLEDDRGFAWPGSGGSPSGVSDRSCCGEISSNSQRMDVGEGHWSMTVAGSAEEIEPELQAFQDQMV